MENFKLENYHNNKGLGIAIAIGVALGALISYFVFGQKSGAKYKK